MPEIEGNNYEESADECHCRLKTTNESLLEDGINVSYSFDLKTEESREFLNSSLLKSEGNARAHPNFNDVDRGWAWVVLAGSFGTFCLMGATQFSAGIVHMILLDKYDSGVSLASVAGAVHVSIISIAAPISTFVLERFSCRVAIVTSGCLFFLGYLGTAFAPNIECVIFTYGIVAGFGGALGYTANMVLVGYYFQKKRNIAMGIAVSGAGFGICVLSQLMLYIHTQYGSFGFFLIMSGIFAQSIVFGMVAKPSQLEIYTKARRRELAIANNSDSDTFDVCNHAKAYLTVLSNKAVLFLSLGMFKFCLATYLIYMHFPHYVVEMGFSPSVAANFLSLSGILTVAGRILTGSFASVKCVREDILYCLPMFVLGFMTILYPYISSTFAGNLTYTVFLGLLYGNAYVLTASVSVRYTGIVNLAKAIGVQYFFAGLGALIGPVIAGIIIDAGGLFDEAFFTASAFLLLAGVVSGMATFVSQPNSQEIEIEETEFNKKTSTPL
ncbi:monocarboxylate transporter 9-like isoform X2 [Ruditapes philippinarum]|nr:monocarboxylate transporter 9-like isoform X2 [Ruditapes philippinarum]XP_060565473.1 monocarboxylate transporter 9-like isoform X2 [Ruditapes philippinarum]XP_060565474.1 monocarboxylate transporter 9-like isoform X2 [Ruditapes philippinarum]